MVVRSSIEDAPALLAQRNAQRFIVPPKVSQQFAERHSIFDGKPPDESYSLAAHEAGGVTHKVVASGNPPTFTLVPVSTVSYVTLDPANPSDQRRLTVQTKPEHELNYLPDPFARGVLVYGLPVVTNLPGSTSKLAHIPFAPSDKYPDILPFRLALKIAADDTPSVNAEWDADSQVLTMLLPPAARETIRISSYLSTQVGLNDLAQMGVWDWIASSNPANLDTIIKFTNSGRNWLLMPYREIMLLHAVRRPLSIPAVNNAQLIKREYGATSVTVNMNVLLVDGKSTEKQVFPLFILLTALSLGYTHSYSAALGYAILAHIMEVIDGKRWDDIMRDRLFSPLGLTSTSSWREQVDQSRAATGHIIRSLQEGPVVSPVAYLPRAYGPGGNVNSTAREVVTMAHLFLNGGQAPNGTRTVSDEVIREMMESRAPMPDPYLLGSEWGLGLTVYHWHGETVYAHDGSTIGQQARLRILPDSNLAISMLANGAPRDSFYRKVFNTILSDLGAITIPDLPKPDLTLKLDLSKYEGIYERLGARYEVESEGGKLYLTFVLNPMHAQVLGNAV